MFVDNNLIVNKKVTINARKYDGSIHRSWTAELVERKNSLLIFVGEFEEAVKHPQLGVIRKGTISYEYYWLNRWYNVFRFHEPNGDFRNFYCNINMPPEFENGVLNYVDLDIDILVWNDFRLELLDLDEYEENSALYKYSDRMMQKVSSSLRELKDIIDCRRFPFDESEAK